MCACRSLLRPGEVCAVGRVDMLEETRKVVEVFRRPRDGDPVEIEKNSRCSSVVW